MSDLLVNLRIRAFESVSTVAKHVRAELGKLGELAKATEEKLHGVGDLKLAAEGVGELGAKFREAGAMIREPLVEGAEEWSHLTSTLTKVGNRSGATSEQIAEMLETTSRLGRTTSQSTAQVADGFKALASSGLDAESQLQAIEPTLKFAAVAEMGMGEAGSIAGTLLKRFGLDASQLPGTLDTIAAAAQTSHTSIGDMATAMATAAPNAKRMGVTLADTAAMATALGAAGVKGEHAGAVLSAIITKLASPRRLGAKGLEILGVSTIDKETGKMKTVPAILGEIAKATEKMGAARRERFLSGIFGPEAASSVGLLMASLKGGELVEFTKRLGMAGGKLNELFGKSEALDETERLTNAVHGLGEAVGRPLAEPLGKLKDLLADVINGVTNWMEAHPGLTRVLIYTVAALSALLTAMGLVLSLMAGSLLAAITVMTAGPLLHLAGGFFGVAASVWAVVAPVLAVTAALGAVTLAIVELEKHWKELDIGEGLKGIFGALAAGYPSGGVLGLGMLGQLFDPRSLLKDVGLMNGSPAEEAARVAAAQGGGGTDVGGTLHIKVDGPAQVVGVTQTGPMNLDVDAGLGMAGN